jgi:hypothetical protein
MSSIRNRAVTIGTVIAVVAGVGGVYTFADDIGFQLDRPAFRSEVVALEEKQIQLAAKVNLNDLTRKLRELVEVEIAIAKYRKGGMIPPARLIREQTVLQLEIAALRRELGK